MASVWQLPGGELTFGRLPRLMGIVNVTPDSFSDGFASTDEAVEQALRLAADGADLLDIGGESTRPYSEPVDEQEELRRVMPVVRLLAEQTNVPISIDTSKAAVAEQALDAGAQVINDVTGLEGDPRMIDVAVSRRAAVCAMHMRGTPQTMQDSPRYADVVDEIHEYLRLRRDALQQSGIPQARICLDPGIGFGKTHAHNLELLSACGTFRDLGCPLLVGHSRKGFIAHVLGDKQQDRLSGTIGAALALATQGVEILRVHDVAEVRQALQLFEAAGGLGGSSQNPPTP